MENHCGIYIIRNKLRTRFLLLRNSSMKDKKTGWIIIYLPQNVNDISENYVKGIPALEGMCVIGRKIHKIKC